MVNPVKDHSWAEMTHVPEVTWESATRSRQFCRRSFPSLSLPTSPTDLIRDPTYLHQHQHTNTQHNVMVLHSRQSHYQSSSVLRAVSVTVRIFAQLEFLAPPVECEITYDVHWYNYVELHVLSQHLVCRSIHISDYRHTVCLSDSCVQFPLQPDRNSRWASGFNVLRNVCHIQTPLSDDKLVTSRIRSILVT